MKNDPKPGDEVHFTAAGSIITGTIERDAPQLTGGRTGVKWWRIAPTGWGPGEFIYRQTHEIEPHLRQKPTNSAERIVHLLEGLPPDETPKIAALARIILNAPEPNLNALFGLNLEDALTLCFAILAYVQGDVDFQKLCAKMDRTGSPLLTAFEASRDLFGPRMHTAPPLDLSKN